MGKALRVKRSHSGRQAQANTLASVLAETEAAIARGMTVGEAIVVMNKALATVNRTWARWEATVLATASDDADVPSIVGEAAFAQFEALALHAEAISHGLLAGTYSAKR